MNKVYEFNQSEAGQYPNVLSALAIGEFYLVGTDKSLEKLYSKDITPIWNCPVYKVSFSLGYT